MISIVLALSLVQAPAAHIAAGDSAGMMHPDVQLHHYQAALAEDSGSYEANWKAAQAIANVAKQIQGNADSLKNRRDSLYAVGRTYAERAIRADSMGADGHYVLAMVLGRLSRTKGSKERVKYAKLIYDEAEKAVALNPNHDNAHHVLGAWNAEVKRLSGIQRFFAKTLFGGEPTAPDHENVPTAVFANPNLATVGLSEEQARERHGAVEIYKTSFRSLKHALTASDERIFMKLVVEAASGRVLGAHTIGPEAAEIIQGIAIAVKLGATKAQFDATIGIHPTAAEEFVTLREPVVS